MWSKVQGLSVQSLCKGLLFPTVPCKYCDAWLSCAMKPLHPFMHLFNKHLLISHCMLGTHDCSFLTNVYITIKHQVLISYISHVDCMASNHLNLVYRFLNPVFLFNAQITNFCCNELVLLIVD